MRRIFSVILFLAAVLSAGGASAASTDAVDIDLTQLSGVMAYSEVFNMMTAPDDYVGKTVRIKGNFASFSDEATDEHFFAVMISDAAACCQLGLDFVLDGGGKYPDAYPDEGAAVTVVGKYEIYKEGENKYCRLIHAKFE